jgi:hypothetical protein
MSHGRRGAALPETAIVISVALLVLFGAVQLALIGYFQAMADGASFIGAWTVAQKPQGDTADQTHADNAVRTVFPKIDTNAHELTIDHTGTTVSSTVTKTVPGLDIVPGAPSTLTIHSRTVESLGPTNAQQGFVPGPYPFAVSVKLTNYYAASGVAQAPRCIYVAQQVGTYIPHGGSYRFSDWYNHDTIFQSLNFPTTRPNPDTNGYFNPMNPNNASKRGPPAYARALWTMYNTWDPATC